MTSPLILASKSERRKDLLKQIGIIPSEIISPDIDESTLKKESPTLYVKRIAKEKAAKIHAGKLGSFIIAADTIVVCGKTILPKAESKKDVKNFLLKLSGRSHNVITTVCIIAPQGKTSLKTVNTRVYMKKLSSDEIDKYVSSNEGVGKAGGYAIQGLAGAFVQKIKGSYSSVVGLPLMETNNMLTGLGYVK